MKKILFFFLILFFSSNVLLFAQPIAAGYNHSVILCGSGTLKACGGNWDGELGDGTFTQRNSPASVQGLSNITSIAVGDYHTLALKNDGTVWAWGYNGDGQLGDGTTTDRNVPVQITSLSNIIGVYAGGYHSFALKNDGTVWAWGYNGDGQLGDGTTTGTNTPIQITALTGVTSISASYYYSLALKSDGTVLSWGYNGDGELGDGTFNNRFTPGPVSSLTGITQIDAGYYHALARKSNGTAWSWGANWSGELGDGTFNDSNVPILVTSLSNVAAVSGGSEFSLFLKMDGTVWSAGYNGYGNLGDGTFTDRQTPVQVLNLSSISNISAGSYHSIALKNDGTFWAWGDNNNGQVGVGTSNNEVLSPQLMKDCCNNLPDLALSDTCVVDTIEIGGTSQTYLFIKNPACGVLNVTNITSNNAAFSFFPTSANISNNDSILITVSFSPTILGNNTGTLTIFNNVNDTTMCLAGYCIQAPVITHSPSSFNRNLNCDDATSSTLNIGNTGPGTLTFNAAPEASSTNAIFYDGFESGNISSWNNEGGAYTYTVINAGSANGTKNLYMSGGSTGWLDGISHSVTPSQPSYISFKIKSALGNLGESNDVLIGQTSDISSTGPLSYLWIDNNNKTVNMYTGWSGTLTVPLKFNKWHKIEYRNINFTTHKFDFYIDGNLLQSNITFQNQNINSIDIIHLYSYNTNNCYFDEIVVGNFPEWLSVSPASGTVATSGSQNLSVQFSSNGLIAGTYYGNLSVNSNDPTTPLLQIPCTLNVAGSPNINLTLVNSCPTYSTIMVGATEQNTFLIENLGCDTLFISNVSSSSSHFTINSFPAKISPYSSANMFISFAPTTAANHSTTILIQNNDADTSFCLQGVSIPAPTVSVAPTSFSVTVACGGTYNDNLFIQNIGAADLNYNLTVTGQSQKITYSESFTQGVTPTTQITSWVAFRQLLVPHTYSKLKISGSQNPTGITLTDPTVIANIANAMNTLTPYSFTTGGNMWTVGINNCNSGVQFAVNTTVCSCGGGATSYLIRPEIGTQNWGGISGTVCNAPSQTMTLEFTFDDFNWLTASPITGTVTPTNTTTVSLSFNSAGLSAGTYTSTIHVNSNDPATPIVNVPIVFNVVGNPQMGTTLFDPTTQGASPPCMNLDSIMAFTTSIDSILISNSGCDTLRIDSLKISPSEFTVLSYVAKVPPGQNRNILVKFSPTSAGTFSGSLDIFTNDPDTSICLHGKAFPQPTIGLSPNSFSVTISGCNGIATQTLTVNNTGGSTLNYNSYSGISTPGAFKYGLVTNSSSSNVSVIDLISNKVVGSPITVGNFPWRIAVRPDGLFAYSSNRNGNSISVINLTTKTVTATIPFGTQPGGICITPDGKFAYVGDHTGTTVKKIDLTSNTIVATITNPNLLDGKDLAISPDGKKVYVTTENNGLTVINVLNDVVIGNLPSANSQGHSIALSLDGTKAYVSEANNDLIRVINTASLTTITTIFGFNQVQGIDLSNDGNFLYAIDKYNQNIRKISTASNTIVATLSDPRLYNGWDIIVSPNGKKAFVSNESPNNANEDVIVIDLTSFTISGTITTTVGTRGMATNKFATWLTEAPQSGSVPTASSGSVVLTFNAAGLNAGTYVAPIYYHSNDPLNPVTLATCTMTILGAPVITPTKNCLYLDSIMEFTTNKDSLYFKNTGCDTLKISNITKQTSLYTINTNTFSILPGDSAKLIVTFSPIAAGTFYDTLDVINNDALKRICLLGKAFLKPVIGITPTSFTVNVNCTDTIQDTIFVSNTGGSILNYNLVEEVIYDSTRTISLNTSGQVSNFVYSGLPPSDSLKLVITLNGDFNSGSEYAELYIDGTYLGIISDNNLNNTDMFFYYSFGGAQVSNWLSDGTITVTLDNSPNVGSGGFHRTRLMLPGMSWLSAAPTSGSVPAGSVDTVIVVFNSSNLIVGQYIGNIYINSNDPLNNSIAVPCTLNVNGAADFQFVGLSDVIQTNCLNLDSIMEFTTSSDTIFYANVGCDTLFVDSVKFSLPQYSAGPIDPYVLPGDTGGFVVNFAPISTGTFAATASLYTNDLDTTFCLIGKSFPKPVIHYYPSSFSVTLTCSDTISLPLAICDSGGSILYVQLEKSATKIKALLLGADYANYYTDVQSKLMATGKFTAVDIFETRFGTPTLSQLQTYDAVLTWNNYSYQNATLLGDVLADYVDAGGGVVVAMYTVGNNARILGRFDSQNYWCINVPSNSYSTYGAQTLGTVYDPTHPIMEGVSVLNATNPTISTNSAIMPGAIKISDWSGGKPLVVTKLINGHRRVDLGMRPESNSVDGSEWNSTSDGGLLIANALLWSSNKTVDWMVLSADSDTVSVNNCDTIQTSFISTGLLAGTYTTNIIITSNDPLSPSDTIPVTLTVVGTADFNFVALSDTVATLCLDLDSIMEFTTSRDTIFFTNLGCDTLFVDSVKFSLSAYTLGNYDPYIIPGDTGSFVVNFSPVSTGTFTGTASLYTNDLDTVFCLKGKAFAKPVQCHNPNSFYEHFLVCNDSLLDTLEICNSGAGNLNYNLWSPYGRSAVFNGSGASISTPLNIDQNTGSPGLTMEAWVNPASTSGGYHHVVSTDNGGYDWSILRIGSLWYVFTGENVRSTGMTATPNQWQHVAAVFIPGTGINFYLNGNLATIPFIGLDASDNSISIGRNPGFGEYFDGKIDEVRVFNKQLSQSEINDGMRKTLNGNENGLLGYWNFDDSTATDFSTNTNDGTLNAGAYITVPNVSFLPASTGTVSPSGTYSVQVKFKKAGLAPGTHNFPIYLNSNDPLNSVDTVNVTFDIDALPPAPTASSNSPVCDGTNLSLTASTIIGATYSWNGPNGFTSTTQNPVITGISTAGSGSYSVTATISGCPQGPAGTTTVIVNPAPSTPTAGSNGTVCSGTTLTLSATTISGATYSWNGPNGFTSTLQNPSIPGVTTAASGTYSVTASVPGCPPTSAATTTVAVNQTPNAPTAGSNAPICAGDDLSLTASTISGVTYAWTGPNTFSSTLQNPNITAATTAATGTYSVFATQNGCAGPKGTVVVIVNPAPGAPTAGSNSTVCSGTTLSLTASTIPSATYAWSGPNSFTSTLKDPTISAVTSVHAGTYSVTATVPGCPTSPSGTVVVAVNQTPAAPTAGSNSPVCVGNDISLTASTISGATYSWNGPNSFTNTLQNPIIIAAGTIASGTYSVSATVGGCTGSKGTTAVIVNPAPGAPIAGSNSTVCSGQNLSLTANTFSGASYSWMGPNAFSSSLQNPFITNAATSDAGTYSVTATVGGCPTSPTGTVLASINQSPAAPTAGSNSPVCSGSTISLTASTISGAIYSWTGPLSFTSTLQNPSIASVTTARGGTYSVSATVSGCPSPAGIVSVIVNQTPAAPSAGSNSPICSGFTLSLTANTISGATYSWTGPNSFSNTSQNPSIAGISSSEAGTYSVNVSVNGCIGPNGTTSVVVNNSPSSPTAGSNSPVCSGQTLSLNATTISGATYAWSGPNSFSSTLQNPTISGVTTLASGTYSVSAVAGGCPPSAPGTVSITINQTPAAPTAGSNTPVCLGTTLSLTASTISGATYIWTGPNAFSDATQNPTISSVPSTGAGTYSVNATVNGCTGPIGTTSVVINLPPSAPTAGNNSTICSGQTLSLTASTISGANYSWSGPNSFTSTLQNPNITSATTSANGTYSVIASVGGCPASTAGTTLATINQTPTAPAASSNSPVCAGFTLSLTASNAGTTYSWTGPTSFTNTNQNPTIASAGTINAGTYSVTASSLGCTGPVGTTSVIVNTIPAAPTASNQNGCIGNTIPDLTASGTNIQWYDNLLNLVGSGSPFTHGQTAVGSYTYSASQTVNGCTSLSTTITLTINALPVKPNAGADVSICYGNTIPDLTASGTNIQWYNSLGNLVGTGSPYATGVTAPGSYTFFPTQTNTVTTCESLKDTVVLTINSIAPPVAPDVAVCAGNPIPPLVATGTGIQWFDNGMNLVFSGNSYNTGQTAVGTYTYYVSQTNTVTTCSSPVDTVYLVISSQPTVAPIAQNNSACFGSVIPNLIASSGTIINWYSDAGLTNLSFTGNPFNTGLTAVGSYTYFLTDSTPGCPEGPAAQVMLKINSLPASLSVNDTASCFGNTTPALITAGTNIQWYNSALVVVSTNDTFATGQTAVGTYTYYVTQTNSINGCESLRDTILLTIHALPNKPLALDTVVCSAATIPNLTTTGTNAQWYNASNILVFTGNSFATGQTAPGTYTYYVTQQDVSTGCESVTDTSTLSIMLSPPVPVANNVAVCLGNPIPPLTSTGTNIKWYSNSNLTTLVFTGNTFNTGQTTVGVYTYYLTDSLIGCVSSSADSAMLTISAPPVTPVAANNTICYGATPTLTCTGTNPQWHSDATLINVVGTGNTFNTGLTSVGTYTYYVTDFSSGCGKSLADTVVLSINPTPLVTTNTYTTTIVQGSATNLTAYNAITYVWSPVFGLNNSTGNTVAASPTVTTTYTVSGTNAYGCTNSVSILVIVNPLSVASVSDPIQNVNIYPNPAIGSFTLEFNTTLESPMEIYLLNTLGERVREIKTTPNYYGGLMQHKYIIDANTLTEGVYNVEIVTNSGSVNRRVIIFR